MFQSSSWWLAKPASWANWHPNAKGSNKPMVIITSTILQRGEKGSLKRGKKARFTVSGELSCTSNIHLTETEDVEFFFVGQLSPPLPR